MSEFNLIMIASVIIGLMGGFIIPHGVIHKETSWIILGVACCCIWLGLLIAKMITYAK